MTQQLQEAGLTAQADRLMADLLTNQLVSQPGQFGLIWGTGFGSESVSMTFKGVELMVNEADPVPFEAKGIRKGAAPSVEEAKCPDARVRTGRLFSLLMVDVG